MIWLNYKGWATHKFSTRFKRAWIWKRIYRNGHRWTPFIVLEIKKINK